MTRKENVVHEPVDSNGQPPKWVIMIYLAGDGTLSAHCVSVLQQLETVAYKKDVRVLACYDSNTPVPNGARYFEISRERPMNKGFNWELHEDLFSSSDLGFRVSSS